MGQVNVATLTFQLATGSRAVRYVHGTDENLDSRIIDAIGMHRAAGQRIVKAEMTINGEEWIYEYDSTGHIERIFRNGAVTP